LVFFNSLSENDLIEIVVEEETSFLPLSNVSRLEQIVRIHRDLEVNIEGVDIILNLLYQVDQLENELAPIKNRLGFYENE
jgi:hypothetical protein